MSAERRPLLRALGANLELTPAREGMRGALERAHNLALTTLDSWMPQQFDNPTNPAIHEATTGAEIWADPRGEVDIFVSGVGTGGTITGVSHFLRRRRPGFQAIAVEPATAEVG
jgi:cysteine synthase A